MTTRRLIARLLAVLLLGAAASCVATAPTSPGSETGGSPPPASDTVCRNSDHTLCPASYFTGPLGKRNLVPNGSGAFLIEYYAGVGTNWADVRTGVESRQSDIGRKFDGIQVQYYGAGTWGGLFGMSDPHEVSPSRESWIIDNGSFVAISWTPEYTIGQMNQGAADKIWAKAADYWKTFSPHPIMLRAFAEFNLPSRSGAVPGPENENVDYCGTPFINAWQRMVRIFQQQGATNVGFWFSPDEGNGRQCVIDSYPGDKFVDWVGSDSYNRCTTGERECYSTPLRAGPATFGELFNYRGICADDEQCSPSTLDLFGPKKPFVVGEVGTVYDPRAPNVKANFYRSVPQDAMRMKYLRGVSFFDADVSAIEGADTNWRVDNPPSQPEIYTGFQQMASSSWFRVGIGARPPIGARATN